MSTAAFSYAASSTAFFDQPDLNPFPTAAERQARERPLLPSRNNSNSTSSTLAFAPAPERTAFRYPRPYVQACCKGTLGLVYESGRVVFRALACNSWSCPHCRKRKAANLLDRLRRGMAARPDYKRGLVTLTVDPSQFGAICTGTGYYTKAGKPFAGYVSAETLDRMVARGELRATRMWRPPTAEQYEAAYRAMSKEVNRLLSRLRTHAKRQDLAKWGYFRVVELHRNGWPHYHLVFEHPILTVEEVGPLIERWALGIVHYQSVESLDDLVGEVAPYLTSPEAKGKEYQFAASALPKHFRLWSCSKDFLAAPQARDPEADKPINGIALRGHFTDYGRLYEQHSKAREPLSHSLELVHAPHLKGEPITLPSATVYHALAATPGGSVSQVQLYGDLALTFYATIVSTDTLEVSPALGELHKSSLAKDLMVVVGASLRI